jgi:hypothetical protein
MIENKFSAPGPNIQKWLIAIFLLIYLLPFIRTNTHPTIDGSAHVYNAHLLGKMLIGNEFVSKYLYLNSLLIPNNLGHFILLFLQFIIPLEYVEKCFQILLLLLSWHSFYLIIRILKNENIIWSILILPFTYSFLLISGFYNFLIGIPLIFYGLYFYFQKKEGWLFLISLLSYFAHIIIGCAFLMIQLILFITGKNSSDKMPFGHLLKVNLPAIILCLSYLINNNKPDSQFFYLKPAELFSLIYNLRPLINYSWKDELFYNATFGIFLLIFSAILIIIKLKSNVNFTKDIFYKLRWLIVSLAFLLIFTVTPDSSSFAGFLSVRFCFLFLLFLCLFIAEYTWNNYANFILCAVIFFYSLKLFQSYPIIKDLSAQAAELTSAGKLIEENSIVHVVDYSDNWLKIHFNNNLGMNKTVILDENYEAENESFPLGWKNKPTRINVENNSVVSYVTESPNYILIYEGSAEKRTHCINYVELNGKLKLEEKYSGPQFVLFKMIR